MRALEEMSAVSIRDVIERWSQVKDMVAKASKSKLTDLLEQLKGLDHKDDNGVVEWYGNNLKPKELSNVIEFCRCLHDDELVSYLMHVCDKAVINKMSENMKELFTEFKDQLKSVKRFLR